MHERYSGMSLWFPAKKHYGCYGRILFRLRSVITTMDKNAEANNNMIKATLCRRRWRKTINRKKNERLKKNQTHKHINHTHRDTCTRELTHEWVKEKKEEKKGNEEITILNQHIWFSIESQRSKLASFFIDSTLCVSHKIYIPLSIDLFYYFLPNFHNLFTKIRFQIILYWLLKSPLANTHILCCCCFELNFFFVF